MKLLALSAGIAKKKVMERYARQLLVPQWDQEKLSNGRVVVAGVGALGNVVATQLAIMGVGYLHLIDRDKIEESNLSRQPLYSSRDIGKTKTDVARQKLLEMNPNVVIKSYPQQLTFALTNNNITADVVVDCLDNLESRLWLNNYCIEKRTPLVSGGVYEFRGQLQVVLPGKTPCLQCNPLLTPATVKGDSCGKEKNPGIASTCYVVGGLQATETIKILMNLENICTTFRQIHCDTTEIISVPIKRKKNCAACKNL